MKYIILFCISTILLSGCERFTNTNGYATAGWVPVYAQTSELGDIGVDVSRPTQNAGKIYVYNNYIFQNEQYKGFHIVNNSNTANPVKTAFLKVPFSTEISIKNNYLYTNSVSDLLVFDISNINSPNLVKRVPNAFPIIDQQYPPISEVYFECPDASKGIIVNWEFKNNITAKCRR